jgi:hypothetical protein
LLQQRRFVLRYQQRGVEVLGDARFPVGQFFSFAGIEPRHRPALGVGILSPLVGIDVDHVHHAARKVSRHELRHRRGIRQAAGDGAGIGELLRPVCEFAVAVIRQRQRLAGQQPAQARQLGEAAMQRQQLHLGAPLLERVAILPVVRIVDEGAEMDAISLAQMPQQMERADLVALVGRVRDAVSEEKQAFHGSAPESPLPLEGGGLGWG